MPRKGVVRKRSRPVAGPERRSKARHDPARQPPPDRSPPRVVHVRPLAGKAVTSGRYVTFDYLSREGFTIGDRLRAQGLEYFLTLDLPTYPGLVQEFYSTVHRGDGGIEGTVLGVPLRVTEDLVAHILHLPLVGVAPAHPEDRFEALTIVLGQPPQSPLDEVSASSLPIEVRILLSILSRSIFPKTGRFDFVNERDLAIMSYILQDTPVNFPKLIYRYMCEPLDRPRLSLPYGMIFTLLFRQYEISIPEREPSRALRWTDRLGTGTMHRMEFRKKDGIWVRKSTLTAQTTRPSPSPEPDSDYPDSPHHPDLPSTPPAPTTSAGPSSSAPPSMEVRIDPEQLRELRQEIVRDLRDELLRELRGSVPAATPAPTPAPTPSSALVPSLTAVTDMTAKVREEIYNIRDLMQAQFRNMREIKSTTRQFREEIGRDMHTTTEGAERLSNVIVGKLDALQTSVTGLQTSVTELSTMHSRATSSIITQLSHVTEAVALLMERSRLGGGATSSRGGDASSRGGATSSRGGATSSRGGATSSRRT